MIIEDSFEIDVPIGQIFEELNNVGEIGHCIAGVKKVTAINADESQWTVEARAGYMARTFNLTGKITERRAPEYLAFSAAGQDVKLAGHVQLITLGPNRTLCTAKIEVTVIGPFASIIDLMAKGPQQTLIRQTIKNLQKYLQAKAPAPLDSMTITPPADIPRAQPERVGVAGTWLPRLRTSLVRSLIENTQLREIVDRNEIHDALMRYCRGVDRQDEALINSAFHPDAIYDLGTPGLAREFARKLAQTEPVQRMHLLANLLIELDGDTANVESYFISFSTYASDGKHVTRTRGARAIDRFERRKGEWKIAYRLIVDEWARLDPVVDAPTVGALHGTPGRDDPIYHFRELMNRPRPK